MEEIGKNIQNFIGQKIYQAQKSVQLFHYLTNSEKESSHVKVMAYSINYMDDDTPVVELLFKLMMQKAIIDTRATATHLRENIINLDTYMSTVNSNIEKFNQYVNVNVDGLK